jgi:hypothetical protein
MHNRKSQSQKAKKPRLAISWWKASRQLLDGASSHRKRGVLFLFGARWQRGFKPVILPESGKPARALPRFPLSQRSAVSTSVKFLSRGKR